MIRNLLICLCVLSSIFCQGLEHIKPPPGVKEVPYSYAGNFFGWLSMPKVKTRRKLPVIIYNYDEYWDWAGKKLAERKGYNLHEFMKVFNRWGFVCLIPMERYRKLNALKGAIRYAKKLPYVDPNNIHVVGLSEGAFLSLLSLKALPHVSTITLLAPQTINYTGHFSLPELLREIDHIQIPILFMLGTEEKTWRLRIPRLLLKLLVQNKKKVTVVEYPVEKDWFRNHNSFFLNDIHHFITGKQAPALKIERPGNLEI